MITAMAAMWEYQRLERMARRTPTKVVGPYGESKAHFRAETVTGKTRCGRDWEHEWWMDMVQPNDVCQVCVRVILAPYAVVAE